MSKLTDSQWQTIASRYEAGEKPKKLSLEYGISIGLIDWNMLRLGANPPGAKLLPQMARGPVVVQRGNHVVRHYTPEEDAQIEQWSIEGLSINEIGRRLGRKHNSIKGRLMTLARQAARRDDHQEATACAA